MNVTDDIEKLRTLLLAEAQNAPLVRQQKNSKEAKIRALYPDLLAIKKRSPHVTCLDLTKMLQNIGLDVSIGSVRRVMRMEKTARPGAKRANKAAIPKARKTATPTTKSSDVPSLTPDISTINRVKAQPDYNNAIFRRNPNDPL